MIIILIGFPFAKNAIKQHKINQEISDYKKEITSLQNKSLDLKKFVSYLESDQFAEEQARLSLNLKKSGEELTVIKNSPGDLSATSSSGAKQIFDIPGYRKEAEKPESSNPRKWLNYFFKM
jgi:predicted  nucleic acid-binding Zn-ribbon protein